MVTTVWQIGQRLLYIDSGKPDDLGTVIKIRESKATGEMLYTMKMDKTEKPEDDVFLSYQLTDKF